MKKYKIPVEWQKFGILEIEAENINKAIELAIEIEEKVQNGHTINGNIPLESTVDIIKSFAVCKSYEEETHFYRGNIDYYKKFNEEE